MAKKPKETAVLDIPVEFGGLSINKGTCRLSTKIHRDNLNIVAADETFCGHRLSGKVVLGKRDDAKGTQKLPGMENSDVEVGGTFDVKRIGVTPDLISVSLTFSLLDIDIGDLAFLSKAGGAGKLVIFDVAELPDDSPAHDEDGNDEPKREPVICEGDWKSFPLAKLFKGKMLEDLHNANLKTVGKLSAYMEKNKLADLSGFGPGKAEKAANVMRQFWADNPGIAEEEPALA